jgi:DNA-binding PadR family transcriptional regulator
MSASMEQPDDRIECHPLAPIPAWWCAFLFQILNPRQVCMYAYLAMLCSQKDSCHPTTDQIRGDLGLYSTSMVFEALGVLEQYGFIERERRSVPGTRPRRNVYRLRSCEATLLRLLELELIDGLLRPINRDGGPRPVESERLVGEGLAALLDGKYQRYAATPDDEKRPLLMELLASMVQREDVS